MSKGRRRTAARRPRKELALNDPRPATPYTLGAKEARQPQLQDREVWFYVSPSGSLEFHMDVWSPQPHQGGHRYIGHLTFRVPASVLPRPKGAAALRRPRTTRPAARPEGRGR